MTTIYKLAKQIHVYGITHVFGVLGSGSSLELVQELLDKGIQIHCTYSESAAAIMAGTVGRITGKSGVAFSIKGPGLTNMLPGIALNNFEGFPMVAIVESYHPEDGPKKAHKRIDHLQTVMGVSKGIRYVSQNGPDFSDMATWAESDIQGPVIMNLTNRCVDIEKKIEKKESYCKRFPLELLHSADKPVIIAGKLAMEQGWSEKLNSLNVPIFTTVAAKGVVNEYLAHSAGIYTGVGLFRTPETQILPEADLVIGIGLRANELLNYKPFNCNAINIDVEYFEEYEDIFSAVSSVNVFDDAIKILQGKQWGMEVIKKSKETLRAHILKDNFSPAHVYETFMKHFDSDMVSVLDTGLFCTIGEHILLADRSDAVLMAGKSRYMGVAIPMGLAASLVNTSLPVVVFVGDGGIATYLPEIKLAVKYQLPLILVLMSDKYMGTIRMSSIEKNFDQTVTSIYEPSWLNTLKGLGVSGMSAIDTDSLNNILNNWNLDKGPIYIEIPFNPDEYLNMTKDIR